MNTIDIIKIVKYSSQYNSRYYKNVPIQIFRVRNYAIFSQINGDDTKHTHTYTQTHTQTQTQTQTHAHAHAHTHRYIYIYSIGHRYVGAISVNLQPLL